MSQKNPFDRNKNEMSDEELMRSYQHDEPMAFEILFKRYSNRVLGFLSKRLLQPQLAQDLTQEVFLKLHRSRFQYIPSLPFAPWLFSITRSVWLDYIKKNKKEEPTKKEFLEKLSSTKDFEPVFKTHDEILEQLLPNQKTAVTMRIYEDATFEEIADRLFTTSTNARQLVSRGFKRLKQILKTK